MLRLIAQKASFTILVAITIIFFVHMGMRMVHNSDTAEPSYDLVRFGQLAWGDTRAYLTKALDGDLGSTQVSGAVQPISVVLLESYKNSMGLLIVALAAATILGLLAGSTIALTRRKRLITLLLAVTLALALGLTFLILNLLLDIAYWVIDPRIRDDSG